MQNCNINALFSFDYLLFIYQNVSNTPTAENYEIIHADTRYCTL